MARSRSGEKNEKKKVTRKSSDEDRQLASDKTSEEEAKLQEKVFFSKARFCLLDSLLPGEKLDGFVLTGIDLINKNIRTFSSQDLLDSHCIFVFFPNNFTDASTNLVSFLREMIIQFQKVNFKVFTVSTDSVETNLAWIDLNWSSESDIPIPLNMLSDINGDLCRKFGVFDEETHRAYTSVFLIDNHGIIQGSTVCGHNGIFANSIDCLIDTVNSMKI